MSYPTEAYLGSFRRTWFIKERPDLWLELLPAGSVLE